MNFEITSLWLNVHKNSKAKVESMMKQKAYNQDNLDGAVNKYLSLKMYVMRTQKFQREPSLVWLKTERKESKQNSLVLSQFCQHMLKMTSKPGLLACRVKGFLSPGMQYLLKLTNSFLQCIGALFMLVL